MMAMSIGSPSKARTTTQANLSQSSGGQSSMYRRRGQGSAVVETQVPEQAATASYMLNTPSIDAWGDLVSQLGFMFDAMTTYILPGSGKALKPAQADEASPVVQLSVDPDQPLSPEAHVSFVAPAVAAANPFKTGRFA